MTEGQSALMSKIKNCGLDQYGAESFEQQQFGTAGFEGVKNWNNEKIQLLKSKCSTTFSRYLN